MPTTWKQGEHVVLIGDTGSGKTYLESKLLDYRQYVIVVRTKPDDIKFPGFRKVARAEQLFDVKIPKFLFVPKYELQASQIAKTLERAFKEGGWTIALDETYYLTDVLRMGRPINKLMTQGRSKHLTMVCGMQRPAWISRFAISQATHAFIFRCEGRDLNTLSQALSPRVVGPVQELSGHDFVYYNRVTREVKIGNANRLNDIFTPNGKR